MARYSKTLFLLLSTTLLLLFSCQEGGEAGDLLGMWHLSGTDDCYISFSGSIVSVKQATVGDAEVLGNFQHHADSLFLHFYSIKGLQKDTLLVEELFGFRPIHDVRLRIEHLDADRLTVSQNHQSWTFTKW